MFAHHSMMPIEAGGDALLIIDPQVDFHPGGSLQIPTAGEDAQKIVQMIQKLDTVTEIYVTLDSHSKYHIAHSLFWQNADGEHPKPYTQITGNDINKGLWFASKDFHRKNAREYVKALELQGNFTLTIWPDHCLVGSPGHAVYPIIRTALEKWEEKHCKPVRYILKGGNALTEHYSAFKAEVPLKEDTTTYLNEKLVESLKLHKFVFICGQALSHCVNFSTKDLYKSWQAGSAGRLVVVTDASSSVPGFEEEGKEFVSDCQGKKIQTLKAGDVIGGQHMKVNLDPLEEEQTGIIFSLQKFYDYAAQMA